MFPLRAGDRHIGKSRARSAESALEKVHELLIDGPLNYGAFRVRIDAASCTSCETLFQAMAKLFLSALRRNVLSCCYLLPREVGAGFYVRFRTFANREKTA